VSSEIFATDRADFFSDLIAKKLMHLQLVLDGRSEYASAHPAWRPGGPAESSPPRELRVRGAGSGSP